MDPWVTILPEQAARIAEVTAKTGAAVGLSQRGSVLTIMTGKETFRIDAKGKDISPDQETLC